MTRSKNKRLRLIPSHLPLIRDKLADFAQYRLGELGSQTQYEAMMANAWSMTDQIRTAQLWWVSRDMTRLAEDTVQAGDFPEPDPPAQCGMIFFEGDVQHISFRFDNDGFGETRVAAILWQDVGRESVKISVFTDNPVGIREMHADLFGLPIVSLAPLRRPRERREFPVALRPAARGVGVERGTAYLRGKTGETRYGASAAAAFRPGNPQGQDAGAA